MLKVFMRLINNFYSLLARIKIIRFITFNKIRINTNKFS